jgi:hypothetical protein
MRGIGDVVFDGLTPKFTGVLMCHPTFADASCGRDTYWTGTCGSDADCAYYHVKVSTYTSFYYRVNATSLLISQVIKE